MSNPAQYQSMISLASGYADGVPDLYMYNFNGNNGRFIYTDKAKLLPQSNIRIIENGNIGWIAITEEGDRYYFEAKEYSRSRSATTADGSTVGWYLTKILAANNADSILFSYTTTRYNTEIGYSHIVDFYSNTGGMYVSEYNNETYYNNSLISKQLTKIEFNNGSVEYDVSVNSRLDVLNAPAVKKVIIKDKQGLTLKSIEFKQDYFISNNDKRLKLMEILVYPKGNIADSSKAERYKFTYNTTPLPARNSKAQDHWGYYNGAENNRTLIPSWSSCSENTSCSTCDPYMTTSFSGADRNVNGELVTAGMLEKIVYPTGGYTKFIYEPHSRAVEGNTYKIRDSTVIMVEYYNTSTQSTFKTITSEKYTVPDRPEFKDGLCATFLAEAVSGADEPHYTHAAPFVALYEEGKSTSIASFRFNYSEDRNDYSKYTRVILYPGKTYYTTVTVREIDCMMVGELLVRIPEKQVPSGLVGGCRIKKMQFYTDDNNLVKEMQYEYEMPETPAISSGQIRTTPEYTTIISKFEKEFPNTYCIDQERYGIRLSSNSVWSLGTGSHIGYSDVKVKQTGVSENGSTLYHFSNFDGGEPWGEFDAAWKRGQLLSQTDYNNVGKKVREIRNQYVVDYRNFEGFEGRQVTFYSAHSCAGTSTYNDVYPARFSFKRYVFPSEWTYLKNTEEEIYNPATGNGSILTKKIFDYASPEHKKITKITAFLSNGAESKVAFTYPSDYKGNVVYDSMVKRNIVAPVVEQTAFNGTRELSKTQTSYDFWNGTAIIAPKEIKKSILGNTPETEATYKQYDQYSNPLEYTTKDGITTTYIWGYNNTYPVAKIIGADLATVKAKVTTTGLAAGLTTDATNSLRTIPNALVYTYTYQPLVGMTSETDPNNRTTYYEYDDFNKLSLVRDQDNNIIKKICYNYAGQPEACVQSLYYNTVQSKPFTRNNCTTGATGSEVTYTVPANRYSSATSQAEADQKAKDEIINNGQSYANNNGYCTYYSAARSGIYTRNNCGSLFSGGQATYTVAAGKYTSMISQADADAQAQNEVIANGQAYANSNATCIPLKLYPAFSYENVSYDGCWGDVVVRFYADMGRTVPATATNYNLSYIVNESCNPPSPMPQRMYSEVVNGSVVYLRRQVPLRYNNSYWDNSCSCFATGWCTVNYYAVY